MYVAFEPSLPVDPDVRELAIHRAHRALQGHSAPITQTRVHLSTSLSHTLSSEKRCWVELTLGDSATLIGVAQAAEWRTQVAVHDPVVFTIDRRGLKIIRLAAAPCQ